MLNKFPYATKLVMMNVDVKNFTAYSVLNAFIKEYDYVLVDKTQVLANREILKQNQKNLCQQLEKAIADSKEDIEKLRKGASVEGERTQKLLASPDREYVEQLKMLNDKFATKN